jgi:hypothetical protein
LALSFILDSSDLTYEILNTIAPEIDDWDIYDNCDRSTGLEGKDDIIDFIFIIFRNVPGNVVQRMDPGYDGETYQGIASLTGFYNNFCGVYSELNFGGKRILAGVRGSGC